ncbi:hypothetical protein EYF80_054337 [Liparis tanakae]|uniref:Uncharacterized protein n=1 Tax=Liparis tanakae TaxID=230148 RepID=A0A4Z2F487_9TELE|nr:hypothetical protein EYF80_054337 [Liparis tanakae]
MLASVPPMCAANCTRLNGDCVGLTCDLTAHHSHRHAARATASVLACKKRVCADGSPTRRRRRRRRLCSERRVDERRRRPGCSRSIRLTLFFPVFFLPPPGGDVYDAAEVDRELEEVEEQEEQEEVEEVEVHRLDGATVSAHCPRARGGEGSDEAPGGGRRPPDVQGGEEGPRTRLRRYANALERSSTPPECVEEETRSSRDAERSSSRNKTVRAKMSQQVSGQASRGSSKVTSSSDPREEADIWTASLMSR